MLHKPFYSALGLAGGLGSIVALAASPVVAQTQPQYDPATTAIAVSGIADSIQVEMPRNTSDAIAIDIDNKLLNAASRLTNASPSVLPTPQPEPIAAVADSPADSNTSAEVLVAYQGDTVIPGSLVTSVEGFLTPADFGLEPTQPEIAQVPLVQRRRTSLNRLTTESYSYIGLGGNIGLSDNNNETSLGRGSFVVNGKIGLSERLSVRPAVLINDDATFLIPATYDFRVPTEDPLVLSPFIPFAGAGVAISTKNNNNLGFLLTGGADYRISPNWTANGSLNVGFFDEVDFGIILGVGYTFRGFNF
ncbi:MAG: hypothetical protein SAJ12_02205 [Jaaginema sp. PMC 1079.18]|nr:hypothetical protein [Jaaginema sp. PMC 1080.18]MEC4849801.1 hypothetical protein [Jaaginema sp. PMC 1079.18]MEC4866883.1 hypothetical protein [Jaaginema sp. PMC 1078.18]